MRQGNIHNRDKLTLYSGGTSTWKSTALTNENRNHDGLFEPTRGLCKRKSRDNDTQVFKNQSSILCTEVRTMKNA